MTLITLSTGEGNRQVEPDWQQDGLAVHRGVLAGGVRVDWYTLTHIRSGWAVRHHLDRDEALTLG